MADVVTQTAPVAAPPDAAAAAEFRAMFRRDGDYVWHVLRRLGVRDADREDLTHDVFVAVHRHLSEFDRTRPARPWLFSFAFRAASDYRRRAYHRREVAGDDLAAHVDVAPAADEQLAAREAQDLVLEGLADLDLDRRAVFVMHDVDEIAAPEIAAALGIPLNTVYSRLRVARERFAAAVRRARLRRGEP